MAKPTKQPRQLYRFDIIIWRMTMLGITVDELKSEGFCGDTISRLRHGKNVSMETLHDLAARLQLIPKMLLDFDLVEKNFRRAIDKSIVPSAES